MNIRIRTILVIGLVLTFSLTVRAENSKVRLLVGGDVMLANWVTDHMERQGMEYPFRAIQPILQQADIRFCNLETPIGTPRQSERVEKAYTFSLDPKYVPALTAGGFDVVSMANNHILDFGSHLADSTLYYLRQAGIRATGYGESLGTATRPVIIEGDLSVGFLAYSMTFPREYWATDTTAGTAYPHEKMFQPRISALEEQVDFTVVSFHWGSESSDSTQKYQQVFAHRAIDAGADLIVGHHPHVWQGLEWYRNRLIAYSMGNLCFGSFSKTAIRSGLLEVEIAPDSILTARIHPLNVNNLHVRFQPQPMEPAQAAVFFGNLRKYSSRFDSTSHFSLSAGGNIQF